MRTTRVGRSGAILGISWAALIGCGRSPASDPGASDASTAPQVDAAVEVAKFREGLTLHREGHATSLLAPAHGRGFHREGDRLLPDIPNEDEIALATHADLPWSVSSHGVKARVRLTGAAHAAAATTSSEAVFADVFPSATLLQVAMPGGIEDVVRFAAPARELRYEIELEGVAGLRLVSGVLELLDASGTPRLRTQAPVVVDVNQRVVHGELAVEGCAVDTSRELPFGRSPIAPGRDRCTVIARWNDGGLAYPILVDPSWTITNRLVQARYGFGAGAFTSASGACSTGCVLAVGGYDVATRTPLTAKTAEIYSVATGTWTLTDEVPDGAHANPGVAATGDGRVMLGGGYNGTTTVASAYLFDATLAAGAKWTSVGPLPHGARSDLGAAGFMWPPFGGLPGGKNHYNVVFTGGNKGGSYSGDVDLYDATGAVWTTDLPAMSVPRVHHATVAYATPSTSSIGANNVYVIVAGGLSSSTTDTVEVLDAVAGTWAAPMHLSVARRDLAGVVLDRTAGYVLFAGGITGVGAGATARAEVDMIPAQVPTSVTKVGMLGSARWGLVGAAFGNAGSTLHAMFAGGTTLAGPVPDADTVDMDGGLFATGKSTMSYARVEHQVVTLPNGSVMALGGYTDAAVSSAPLKEEIIANADNGAACISDGDCKSLHCVDGYCCNTACNNQCEACNVAGSLGTCKPVSGAPHGTRPACAGTNATCKGSCDGTHAAACAFPGSGVQCVSGSCSGGVQTNAAYCTGSGDCNTPTTVACTRYACGATACLTSCSKNADCSTGFRCDLTSGSPTYAQCVASGAAGSPCDASHVPSDCTSGLTCVDGVCCSSASCAAGYKCNVAGDPGKCHLPQGAACGSASAPATDCVGGHCVDGVCCNTACSGQCQYCDSTGTCQRTLSGAPHGTRPACAGSGACAAQCDGSSDVACGGYPGTGVVCKTESCTGATDQPTSYCDGAGGCSLKPTINCAPYTCGATTCKASCGADADCATGYTCKGATCVPKVGVTCSSASDCTSGYCVDGYCCDGACNGQCQACDLPGSEGKCTPVVGEQPHGARTRCSDGGGDLCKALQCDGSKDVTKCVSYANGPDKVCEQACTDGTASVAVCDGSGACGTPDKKSCGAFVCDVSTCKTSCASESDCAPGYTCDAASKKCVPQKTTATCSADGTASISADKSSTKPCAPYLCNTSSGDCYATCTGSEQCAGGTVCEQGSCVAHQADGDTGGGCRFSTREVRGRRANGLSVAFAALVALGLMCRRR